MQSLIVAPVINRNDFRHVGFRLVFQDGSHQDIYCTDMTEAVRQSDFQLDNPIMEVLELGL
jgi:hypothetical protein